MEEAIINQLSWGLMHQLGTDVSFPYFLDGTSMTDCKEVAMRREITPKYVLILVDPNLLNSYVKNFKQLSALFNIPVNIEEFVVVYNRRHYTFLSITGWWSKNLLRRELCRLLFKSCYESYKSINGFLKYSPYEAYFLCSAEAIRFFRDLKKNVEAQSGVKLSKAPYSGFFTWMKNGAFKF